MAPKPRAAISWSGGKDSLAAFLAARESFDIVAGITMFDEHGGRSRSHGLRPELIALQAERLRIRPIAARCTWDSYNVSFVHALLAARRIGVTHVIFGDILFPEHRAWAEARCAEASLAAVEPLWGRRTDDLFDRFLAASATAVLVTVRQPFFDASWLGRALDTSMKPEFAARGVDPCGERGEYHSVVIDAEPFDRMIDVEYGSHVARGDCLAIDVIPRETPAVALEWVGQEADAPRG
jgi:uncharacterized protein (TIGR00290 family)